MKVVEFVPPPQAGQGLFGPSTGSGSPLWASPGLEPQFRGSVSPVGTPVQEEAWSGTGGFQTELQDDPTRCC